MWIKIMPLLTLAQYFSTVYSDNCLGLVTKSSFTNWINNPENLKGIWNGLRKSQSIERSKLQKKLKQTLNLWTTAGFFNLTTIKYIHSCLHATSKTMMADFQDDALLLLSIINRDALKDTSTLESCSLLKMLKKTYYDSSWDHAFCISRALRSAFPK